MLSHTHIHIHTQAHTHKKNQHRIDTPPHTIRTIGSLSNDFTSVGHTTSAFLQLPFLFFDYIAHAYTHAHTHAHMHTHTYKHTHTQTHTHTRTHTRTRVRTRIYRHTHVRTIGSISTKKIQYGVATISRLLKSIGE